MTALAIGSSVTCTPRDGGTIAIATNGGFGSVVATPVGGTAVTTNFGPAPVRQVFGPYSEGASLVITNSSCNSLDYDAGTGSFDPSAVAITGGSIGGRQVTSMAASPRTSALRLATFGDSTATVNSYGGVSNAYDQTAMVLASSLATNDLRGGNLNKLMFPMLYPAAQYVAQGGISGETTTQMLARDGLAAAATRNSIQDVQGLTPDLILYRGASINDIVGLSLVTYATDAQVNAIRDRHVNIACKLASCGAVVFDEGCAGFDATLGTVPGNLVYVRDALVRLNAAISASYAATPIPNVIFLSPVGVTCDSTGAFLNGVTATTDGTHLSMYGQMVVSQAEATAAEAVFGRSARCTYKGANLLGSLAYLPVGGSLPTGFVWAGTNCTVASSAIELGSDGEVGARATITSVAASAFVTFNFPINIYTAAPAPNIAVTSGMKLGFEYDFEVQTADGSNILPTLTYVARLNLQNSGGGRLMSEIGLPSVTADTGTYQASRIRQHIAQLAQINDVTANLTSSCAWRVLINLPVLAGGYTIRVKNPRIVSVA